MKGDLWGGGHRWLCTWLMVHGGGHEALAAMGPPKPAPPVFQRAGLVVLALACVYPGVTRQVIAWRMALVLMGVARSRGMCVYQSSVTASYGGTTGITG